MASHTLRREKDPAIILRDRLKAVLFDPARGTWQREGDWRVRRVTLTIPFAAAETEAETQQAIEDATQVRVHMLHQLLGSWATIPSAQYTLAADTPRYVSGEPLAMDVTIRVQSDAFRRRIASDEAQGALYKRLRPRETLVLPRSNPIMLDKNVLGIMFGHLGDWKQEDGWRVLTLQVQDCSKREDSARAKIYAALRAAGIPPLDVNIARADEAQKEAPRGRLRVAIPNAVFEQHTVRMREVLRSERHSLGTTRG